VRPGIAPSYKNLTVPPGVPLLPTRLASRPRRKRRAICPGLHRIATIQPGNIPFTGLGGPGGGWGGAGVVSGSGGGVVGSRGSVVLGCFGSSSFGGLGYRRVSFSVHRISRPPSSERQTKKKKGSGVAASSSVVSLGQRRDRSRRWRSSPVSSRASRVPPSVGRPPRASGSADHDGFKPTRDARRLIEAGTRDSLSGTPKRSSNRRPRLPRVRRAQTSSSRQRPAGSFGPLLLSDIESLRT